MMSKLLFAIFLASLAFAFTTGKQQEQQTEYNQQAEIDAKGNIALAVSLSLTAHYAHGLCFDWLLGSTSDFFHL
jgi:hypothetical protein